MSAARRGSRLLIFACSVRWWDTSAYVWLLKVPGTIARVSTSAFVNPLVAVLLGGTLAHEAISPGIVVAGALIIGAVMLITWKNPSGAAGKNKKAVQEAATSGGT